jgi:hypothetical protein
MQEGFVPDQSGAYQGVPIWIAGVPQKGFLGAKIEGKEAYAIRTFRCVKCGFLESYSIGSP